MTVLVLFFVRVLPMNIHYSLAQFVSNFSVGQTYEVAFQDASLTPESVHIWQIWGKTLFLKS